MKLSNSYIGLPEEFYQLIKPSLLKILSLIAFNEDLAISLGLDTENSSLLEYFSGNKVPQALLR